MISLTINGHTLEVTENTTILRAAEQAGIVIPTLCHHKDLTPYGGCRLCAVDVRGMRLPATACTMLVSPGMVVETETPELTQYRRTVLELLLARFYDAGYTHNGSDDPELDTQFAHWVRHYGIDMKSAMAREPFRQIDSDPNPYIWVDKNKCIMCTRCVRACAEVQGRFVWTQAYRGYDLRIVAGSRTTMLQARCESCGACVAHCPTGALDNRMSVKAGRPDRTVATICPYCGVGCQLYLNIKDDVEGGRVISVSSDARAPVNGDHLCVKGRYGYEFIHSQARLSKPRVRKYLLDGVDRSGKRGPWVEVDWETALRITASGLSTRRDKYGPDSIGLLASAKALNEENYLLNKLARQVIGTNNIDSGAHLTRSSTAEGLAEAVHYMAMSNSMEDILANARSLFVIGTNTSEEHPVFGSGMRQAVLRRKVKLIAACPVFYNMEEYAALPLRYRRGTEIALIKALMRIILDSGWQDAGFIEKHTEGFERLRAELEQYLVEEAAKLTGVGVDDLYRAAEIMARNRPTAVIWGSELSQPEQVNALANLQLLLGNIGVPGGGLAPLRSQNNSQGAADMGGHPVFLPGYQPVMDAASRVKFEAAWGMELPARPGLTAAQMMAAAHNGSLRALFILGQNSWPEGEGSSIRDALERCEFVALCHTLPSEMSRHADVLLPIVTFAETTGTYTSTERRIQLVRQAVRPQGEARPAWKVLCALATRLCEGGSDRRLVDGICPGWDYQNTSEIMQEIASLTPIYAGVSHERLERGEPLLWPVASLESTGTPVLYEGEAIAGRFAAMK
ncbi:MAG TPA: molybdopterin-dependent oxidoreductase [Anaerolineales bacterium]|nr:molybdopterin-dependent oxidoreductase [Anaerolineales bacterium]